MPTLETSQAVSRVTDVRNVLQRQTGGYALALTSGMLWGVGALLLSDAMGRRPFPSGATLFVAPLAAAGLHDCFAAIWLSATNGSRRRLRVVWSSVFSFDGAVVCGAALFGGPVAMSAYMMAVMNAGASYALAMTAIYPVLGAVLGRLFLHERVRLIGWMGVLVTVSGAMYVAVESPSGASKHFFLGIAFALVAAMGWAAEGVMVTRSMRRLDPLVALNIREVVSALMYLAVVLPAFHAFGLAMAATHHLALFFVALGSLAGAASYISYYAALQRIGPARTMPANSTYVIWVIVLGLAVTGEAPTARLITGAIVVLIGITLLARERPATSVVPG
jgi:drug/metabolite transporter (DMT)-like permease